MWPEPASRSPASATLLRAEGLVKSYGPTLAVRDLSLTLTAGRITALVGGNGAGKSTLTRILAGITRPDRGRLEVGGVEVDFSGYTPVRAKQLGVRVVFQELSLCSNLRVYENFFLEHPQLLRDLSWRRQARRLAQGVLEEIFPGCAIAPEVLVEGLSLGERQMVEIARAALDPRLRLWILDEPTSALDAERSAQLARYLRARAREGVGVVYISHRLEEVVSLAEEVLVLRDGALVWQGPVQQTSRAHLVQQMAGRPAQGTLASPPPAPSGPPLLRLEGGIELYGGEVVGLAGLEGSGQRALLRRVYEAARRGTVQGVRCLAPAAFVAGDRRKEGLFPLWRSRENLTLTRLCEGSALRSIPPEEPRWQEEWLRRLGIPPEVGERNVLQLSGGTQQKILMARALLARAPVVLLDDPTRGVDAAVKEEFYRLVREEAARGRLFLWYSSDDEEFRHCTRVLLFHQGRVVGQLEGPQATRQHIVQSAFQERAREGQSERARRGGDSWARVVPLLAFVAVMGGVALLNPSALSGFGLALLFSGALPLVLVALGQMFAVARSEIDLGIGAFAGLANVISATILVDRPGWGGLALAAGLVAYGLMGALIHSRRIPAIVATLGASFVWLGLGYTLQPAPGGSAPDWLVRFFNLSPPLLWVLLFGGLAYALHHSRWGLVLRGFGNNPQALEQGGWSALGVHALTYVLTGFFGTCAGLALTAINTASDVNAATSLTLLSVAAVVMGGSELVGGQVIPWGVVVAALTLSLLGLLLGFLNLSTDHVAAVQGGLLLLIVLLRGRRAR